MVACPPQTTAVKHGDTLFGGDLGVIPKILGAVVALATRWGSVYATQMDQITITDADPDEARALLEASHALMRVLFNPEDNHFLSLDALRAPEITFLVARDGDGAVLGCGGLARRDGYAELKSMFTDEAARGRGIAAAIIDALETRARADGIPWLKLETGNTLEAAHRLYARKGFNLCGPFGDYLDSPASIFMEKRLT